MGRVNVGRVKDMLLFGINMNYLLSAVYYGYITFVRSGDLYRFCRAHVYSAHITVEASTAGAASWWQLLRTSRGVGRRAPEKYLVCRMSLS